MIRIGIGGWNYAPWRETFYPAAIKAAQELHYASRQVTTIEVNGTFYRAQSPASFAKWRDAAPDDFVFAIKGHRAVVSTARLAEAGERLAWFLGTGLKELGPKLGPILWQLAPRRRFDPADPNGFLALLPPDLDGLPLRHALEVRHPSFLVPGLVELLRRHGVALVIADSDDYPMAADLTADFVYARLQRTRPDVATGYLQPEIEGWAQRARSWAQGVTPPGLPLVVPDVPAALGARPVFIYMIASAKERAPAAAGALLRALAG